MVVAGNSRGLNYRIRFSGGGVVPDIFPVHKSITFPRFRDIFGRGLHFRATCGSPAVYGHSRKFRHTSPGLLTHSNHVTTSIHCKKKHFAKVWGAHGPPGYATAQTTFYYVSFSSLPSYKRMCVWWLAGSNKKYLDRLTEH